MTNKNFKFSVTPITNDSLIIKWNFQKHNIETLRFFQAFKKHLCTLYKDDILYSTSAFDSLLVKFRPHKVDIHFIKLEFLQLCQDFLSKEIVSEQYKTFSIPVCYEQYGEDLNFVSKQTKLKVQDIIDLHTKAVYTLYFIGFLPGFLYMGHIDKRLYVPRHKLPRLKVEKGSVGIAENQTGIYPKSSPGGWQIIGRTPVDIFYPNKLRPSVFKPGDQIKFNPIQISEFRSIQKSENPEKHIITL